MRRLPFLFLVIVFCVNILAPSLFAGINLLHEFRPGDIQGPDASFVQVGSYFYGVSCYGGAYGKGAIYRMKIDGSEYSLIHSFRGGQEGKEPFDSLIHFKGALYGITKHCDSQSPSVFYRIQPDGSGFTILHVFPMVMQEPFAINSMVEWNGIFYLAAAGIDPGSGALCTINPDGSGLSVLRLFGVLPDRGESPSHLFVMDGWLYGNIYYTVMPKSEIKTFRIRADGSEYTLLSGSPWDIKASKVRVGDMLFGTISDAYGRGLLFKSKTDGSEFSVLHYFNNEPGDGAGPVGKVVVFDGVIFGMTFSGGDSYGGTIYRINVDGSGYRKIKDGGFGDSGGRYPVSSLHIFNGQFYGICSEGGTTGYGGFFRINPDGSGCTTLHSFADPYKERQTPLSNLTVLNGALVGVTNELVKYSETPSLFRLSPDGASFSWLYQPTQAPLRNSLNNASILAHRGKLYGFFHFSNNDVLFRMEGDGSGFTILRSFSCQSYPSPGYGVVNGLVIVGDTLYGMTRRGGQYNYGEIFKINIDGSGFTPIHTFSQYLEPTGSLVAVNGVLYGIGAFSPYGRGEIFRINLDGSGFTTLHIFEPYGKEGSSPYGPLLFAVDGKLYGVTRDGGAFDKGTIFRIDIDGNNFSVLHSFAGWDGMYPSRTLVEWGGMLYGLTTSGAFNNKGAIFRIQRDGGGFSLLHSFAGGWDDGDVPFGSLLVLDGTLFGVTKEGGDANAGVVYALKLHPVQFFAGAGGAVSGTTVQWVVDDGATTAVTAQAQNGYHFIGWSGSVTGTANPLVIAKVNSAMTITANFAPDPPPLIAPNGGERWFIGDVQNITWRVTGGGGPLTLELWRNGSRVGVIAADLPLTPAAYSWRAGEYIGGRGTAGDGYRIRIVGPGGSDESDAPFTLWSPGLTVTSPNGGETWTRHDTRSIQWTSQGLSGNVKVELLRNGSAVGVVAGSIPVGNGEYKWDVGLVNGVFPAAGNTYSIRVSTTDNAYSDTGDAPFSMANRPPALPAASDLNGDGKTDIFWRYYGTGGFNCVWLMGQTGSPVPQATAFAAPPIEMENQPGGGHDGEDAMERTDAPQWPANMADAPFAAAVDDVMDGDGPHADPPVADPRTLGYARNLPTAGPLAWRMGGVADFDGDGRVDILWRNYTDGRNVVWCMNGLTIRAVTQLQQVATSLNWEIGGVGDFNADGRTDIVWRNYTNGRNVIWLMDRFTIKQVAALPTETDANWRITGVCDFTGDGNPDILWRHVGDGRNLVWPMNRVNQAGTASLPTVANLSWEMAACGDFTGDGEMDLVWRNTSDGRVVVWKMDRFSLMSTIQLNPVSDPDWKIEN